MTHHERRRRRELVPLEPGDPQPPAKVYIVQVFNGKKWAKVRGPEGGPWMRRSRAERIAAGRQAAAPRDSSSTEGRPHRVVEVAR